MITQAHLAKQLNLSQAAVSQALRGSNQVSDETRDRVLEATRRLGYRPNGAARAVRRRRTQQIGVLVPNNPQNRFTHPLAYETVLGINEGLQAAGYLAVLTRLTDVTEGLAKQSRLFEEHVLDGMIVLDSMPNALERELEGMIPKVVWCDANVWREHACIRRDEYAAGRLAAERGIGLGYRRVTMLTYRPALRVHHSAADRFRGVADAAAEAGVALDEVYEPMIGDAAQRRELAERFAESTLLICSSIYQAHTARDIANEAGKVPGRDFALISCDDMHQLNRLWPGLTRVVFDRYGMGLDAAGMMLRLLEDGPGACPSRKLAGEMIAGSTAIALDR